MSKIKRKTSFGLCFSLPTAFLSSNSKHNWFLQLVSSFYSCLTVMILPDGEPSWNVWIPPENSNTTAAAQAGLPGFVWR